MADDGREQDAGEPGVPGEAARAPRELTEAELFQAMCESSPEAMFVVDAEGLVAYANRAAHACAASDQVTGRDFASLFTDASARTWTHVAERFRHGHAPAGVDLSLLRDGASPRTVSAQFSSLRESPPLILVTMRDVTSERALAAELSQTKESLERVIESSVDAIVSADLHGNILLYNQAAARLFGYPKDAVLGKMQVTDLYPGTGAREVMKRIRSKAYGGRGRLQEFRVDMQNNKGERVPVTLSASLVLDGKRAVGTVGIFTDMREKLEMEETIARTQRELQAHDKRAALAELAGAAAHELNQPLTSVMGYAEFLKRSLGDDEQLQRAVDVILRETDRMADIVRKVGQITRYETKDYVGGARIVDIDASSADDS